MASHSLISLRRACWRRTLSSRSTWLASHSYLLKACLLAEDTLIQEHMAGISLLSFKACLLAEDTLSYEHMTGISLSYLFKACLLAEDTLIHEHIGGWHLTLIS